MITFYKLRECFAKPEDVVNIEYCYKKDPKLCYLKVTNDADTYCRTVVVGDWIHTDSVRLPLVTHINYRKITGFTKHFVKCGKKKFKIANNPRVSSIHLHNDKNGKPISVFLEDINKGKCKDANYVVLKDRICHVINTN